MTTITLCGAAAVAGHGWRDMAVPRQAVAFATEPAFAAPGDMRAARRGAARPIMLDRAADGLFYLTARVNGRPVRFLLDTGASTTVLSVRDAARVGLDLDRGRSVPLTGVGGRMRVRAVLVDSLVLPTGDTLTGVDALVAGDQGLSVSLLGQDSIARIGRVLLDGERLTLG